jgi:hypothetical protein
VWLESEVGWGTCFHFNAPFKVRETKAESGVIVPSEPLTAWGLIPGEVVGEKKLFRNCTPLDLQPHRLRSGCTTRAFVNRAQIPCDTQALRARL